VSNIKLLQVCEGTDALQVRQAIARQIETDEGCHCDELL
jgi:hypothetical protein